jgi:hypothetical protein
MAAIKIDADTLFRAVVAFDYKLMAYYLDLRSGEIISRTLTPDEVQDVPHGPRVKPLPLLGGDLSVKKDAAPFGPLPDMPRKPDLFKDDGPKKNAFEGGFWKREGGPKKDPFGGEGHKRESSTKKLAELFGEAPPPGEKKDPFASTAAHTATPAATRPLAETKPPAAEKLNGEYVAQVDENSPLQRIPPASLEQNLDWMRAFAKDCGDPQIKVKLQHALGAAKPVAAFERTLLNYHRLGQQWDRYYRKQAWHYAAEWLKVMPVEWEIVETEGRQGIGGMG